MLPQFAIKGANTEQGKQLHKMPAALEKLKAEQPALFWRISNYLIIIYYKIWNRSTQ